VSPMESKPLSLDTLGPDFLKGLVGDMQNVILSGAGHTIRKILAFLRALGRPFPDEARKAPYTPIAFLGPDPIPGSSLFPPDQDG